MKIVFDDKPGQVYDIFYSLWFMNNYEYAKKRKESFGVYEENDFEEELIALVEDMEIDEKKLKRYFYRELEPVHLFSLPNMWEYSTIDEYLDYIKSLDELELRKRIICFIRILNNPQDEQQDISEDLIIDNTSTLEFIKDTDIADGLKWEMFLLLQNKEQYINEYMDFMNNYLKTYKKLKQKRNKIMNKFNKDLQKKIDTDGLDYLNKRVNNIFSFDGYEEIYLTTSVTSSLYIGNGNGKTCYVIIGPYLDDFIDKINGTNDIEKNLAFIKNICESSRFKIIKLLMKRDYYGQELADELGITRATVSHHMNFLVTAKVVSIEKDGARFYYSLNKDELRNSVEFLIRELEL